MDIINFSALASVHIAIIPIANHIADIFPEELASQKGTTAKRLNEFTSGRYLAHSLLVRAGLSPSPVLRNADRSPAWPQSHAGCERCKGSISHSATLAAAAVTLDPALQGIGIDIEAHTRLDEPLHKRLFTPTESQHFADLQAAVKHPEAVTFSAKEAVYKAINPIAGLMIGFTEVEITLDPNRREFRAAYLPDTDATNRRNLILNSGQGYFQTLQNHVLTVFVIPQLNEANV